MKTPMSPGLLTRLLALLALACGQAAHASDTARLAADVTWLKLGRYEQSRSQSSGFESAVKGPNFFLAADGRVNPESELEATLKALAEPAGAEPDTHAQCRFPARYLWLRSKGFATGVETVSCPAFEGWVYGRETDSISIVFATGYLGNPASYYGHTLLKFNAADQEASDLLDVTVNYGAIIPDGIGPLAYIYNGATGGFDAGFSHIDYYFHEHNYGETELRDLWEYQLNLTEAEVDLVVAHAWELLGHEFVYYFFRRNCAYRMAEVLEIVDGIDIIPPKRPWTVPQAVVRLTAESTRDDGEPLVRKVRYYPSRQAMFQEKYRELDLEERRAAGKIVKSGSSDALTVLPADSQRKIVDALLDYYQYRMPRDEPRDSELSQRYRALLAARFSLPRADAKPVLTPDSGPQDDRPPGYMSVGVAHNDLDDTGAVLRLRPAYYDVLDASWSHVRNSELSMGDLVLSTIDGSLNVERWHLFRVESVSGAESGLPGDNGKSWILALGGEQQFPGCKDCLVTRFDGDIGRAIPVGRSAVVGGYLGATLMDNRNDQGNTLARVTAFANFELGSRIRGQLRIEQRYHIDGEPDWEHRIEFSSRYVLSRNYDLRFSLLADQNTEASLSLGYYW